MHQLHQILRTRTGLRSQIQGVSERLSSNPLLQGIVLELNPIWLVAYQIEQAGLNPELLDGFGWRLVREAIGGAIGLSRPPVGEVDLSRKFSGAIRWVQRIYGEKKDPEFTPFVVKLIRLPSRSGTLDEGGTRDELARVANEAPFPATVEIRPPARTIAKTGEAISAAGGGSGTLGGFLRDLKGGGVFAATCGHVIGKRTPTTGDPSLGTCAYSQPPIPLPVGSRCYASCPVMTSFDLALVDVVSGATLNAATSVAPIVYQGDLVEMNGSASGLRQYEVGGACVAYEIGGSCWNSAFELRPVLGTLMAPGLQLLIQPPPANGDSGSWILRNSTEWCGVVVAADALFGYAVDASTKLKEGDASFGTQLDLA